MNTSVISIMVLTHQVRSIGKFLTSTIVWLQLFAYLSTAPWEKGRGSIQEYLPLARVRGGLLNALLTLLMASCGVYGLRSWGTRLAKSRMTVCACAWERPSYLS